MDAKKLASLFDNPNFAKWFGKSAVVDKAGLPRPVYHGSPNEGITQFDLAMGGSNTGARDAKNAIYFTTKRDVAKGYLGEEFPRLTQEQLAAIDGIKRREAELEDVLSKFGDDHIGRMNSPARRELSELNDQAISIFSSAPKQQSGEIYEAMLNLQDPLIVNMKGKPWDEATQSMHIKAAREAGNDGVLFQGMQDGGWFGKGGASDVYAVFDPTQIKSTANRGTFDPNDPNIYRAALPFAAGAGLMSSMLPGDAEAARIREMDAPLQDAWNPLEAFAGGIPGGLKAAAMGVLPDGAMDWAFNRIGGLMSGGGK